VDARRGFDAQWRGRRIEAFPVAAGVYTGAVKNYAVFDLNMDCRFYRRTRLALAAQNVLNHKHREFVGAPEIGRLLVLRLIQSF